MLLTCLVACLASNAQIISTIAGNGIYGDTSIALPATYAKIGSPRGIIVDDTGNVYFTDTYHNVIKKINAFGILSTFAGTGDTGVSGDGGPAIAATLHGPLAIAKDTHGNIYFVNRGSSIRKISTSGIITTIAGSPYITGDFGDGGPATAALFHTIYGIAIDRSDNIFISDIYNNDIRKISGGAVYRFAGTPLAGGYSGDGGPATAALLDWPDALTVDTAENVYFSVGQLSLYVRMVNSFGIISTIAGANVSGNSGDGGPATAARFHGIYGIAVDGKGNVFLGDAENNAIRVINTNGIIFSYAGNGVAGYSGDGGPAYLAELSNPGAIALDASTSLYICDVDNYRIRKVTASTAVPELNQNHPISITPNPATDIVHINSPCKVTIKLYNPLGTLVAQVANTDQISVTTLPPGIYFIRLFSSSNEQVYQGKILKE